VRNILTSVPGKKEKLPLSVTHPELAKEADGWDPNIWILSTEYVSWNCQNGHNYVAQVVERRRGKGCPYCAGKKVWKGFNDLATTHPELAKEADGWDPSTLSAGSHQSMQWKCQFGHITRTVVKARAISGNQCRVCKNQEVLPGFNDLETLYPEIALSIVNHNPGLIIPGSNKKYNWKCPMGHEFIQSVNQRVNGQGCNICAGKRILPGFNDLATTHPEVAREAYGWNPVEIFGGSHLRKPFKCSEGHTYSATIKDRTVKGSGCPECSKTGFNPGKSGFLYFLEHPKWEMLQIGITNNIDQRTTEHKNKGWQLIEFRGPIDGLLAMNWETAILRMLKAKGADLSNSKIAGKFDGYSEAWSKSTFEVKSIKELMRLTEEFEENPITAS
jgi:predicted GIY-YIG superfamily endonuclease